MMYTRTFIRAKIWNNEWINTFAQKIDIFKSLLCFFVVVSICRMQQRVILLANKDGLGCGYALKWRIFAS